VNLIADALTDEGYLVHTVTDGKSALRAIEQHSPRLIVLDDMMLGMRGIEVVAHLR
jgi:CheY-like chemotaxis protein